MRYLKKLLAVASLAGVLTGCYVSAHPRGYVATRDCRAGWYWNGYRCHYRW
ncbi:MAG TPA: hypothetical protein VGF94_02915 [Kofleriaceae bacterium]|jgi:hypothetical protein